MTMKLAQIWVYPVKSLQGIQLQHAAIDSRGFVHDRHWMLVDQQGNFLSQRRLPGMALINVLFERDGVSLHAASGQPLFIKSGMHENKTIKVRVWEDELQAYPVGEAADIWLSQLLAEPVRLVCMPDNVVRKVDPVYAHETDQTGFSDGFPFLLLGQASVDDLNGRIDSKTGGMDVRRFRPNLVIEGSQAYAEDSWKQIRIGDIGFRVVKPCSRCIITTVDPQTGKTGAEPLKTLNSYRRQGNKVFFGQNLIHDSAGAVRVGDNVTVIQT